MPSDRDELPRLHEQQERQEAANVLASGSARALGVTATIIDGLWAVRCQALPEHAAGNQIQGVGRETFGGLPAAVAWLHEAGCDAHLRWIVDHAEASLPAELEALGFQVDEREGWFAARIDEVPPRPAAHDIRPVAGGPDVEAFLDAFFAGWGMEAAVARQVVRAALGPWPGPPTWRRYVAWLDGRPVGQAILVIFDSTAYLAQAAVAPEARGRGLHRALLDRRIADAREAGCRTVFAGAALGSASAANMQRVGLQPAAWTLLARSPRPTRSPA